MKKLFIELLNLRCITYALRILGGGGGGGGGHAPHAPSKSATDNAVKGFNELEYIFAFCLHQKRLFIRGIDHILVWNLRQNRQTHTNTSTYYANIFVTCLDSHRRLVALLLRVLIFLFRPFN
jgi:hypothetical protein